MLNTRLWKWTDAGETFSQIPVPHGDNHDLWIDPDDPMRMVEGNDGGAIVSFNGGESWSDIMNQPTAQLYHVAVDNNVPYRLYTSQQDNTSITVPSRSDHGVNTLEDWYTVGGGENGPVVRRYGAEGVRVVQRRGRGAAAEQQASRRADPRPGREEWGPGGGDPRPVLLDSGQRGAAASARRRDIGRPSAPFPAPSHRPLPRS